MVLLAALIVKKEKNAELQLLHGRLLYLRLHPLFKKILKAGVAQTI